MWLVAKAKAESQPSNQIQWKYGVPVPLTLHRYLAEFDFRYSNREGLDIDDIARAEAALKGFRGKRLTYETTYS